MAPAGASSAAAVTATDAMRSDVRMVSSSF
jgi:hypothetical protein